MPRFFLIPLLTFTTIAGFASGFHHLREHGWCHRQQTYEEHIADVCAAAALRAQQGAHPPVQTNGN